ncbi:MAG: hypothetical protein NTV11_06595 [Rhodocyclales bacterium]|nr:hypothetical protein [Rhodocyclales bacterium]
MNLTTVSGGKARFVAAIVSGIAIMSFSAGVSAQITPMGAGGQCPAGTVKGTGFLGAHCLKPAAAGQPKALGSTALNTVPKTALAPAAIPVSVCKPKIDAEFKSFTDRVTRGMSAKVITPQEQAALNAHYNTLKADEAKMAKDGLSAQECATLSAGLVHLNTELADALCSREPAQETRAAIKNAVQQAANARHGAKPVVIEDKNGLCVMEIQHEATLFHASVLNAQKANLIDAKEQAELTKSQATVHALEAKVLSDNKITLKELRDVMAVLKVQNELLDHAIATQAPARAPATQAAAARPVSSCQAMIDHATVSLTQRIGRGLSTKQIDAKERAALEKSFFDLLAFEANAKKDGKLDPKECQDIQKRIDAENKQLAQAMMASPSPDHKKAAALALTKKTGKAVAHEAVTCQAEINHENDAYGAAILAGVASGKISAQEKVALDKTHAELIALENQTMADSKITPAECMKIHAKIADEGNKLRLAISN